MKPAKKRVRVINGKTIIDWRLSYQDAEGKRHRPCYTSFREAETARQAIEQELTEGLHVANTDSITVAQGVGVWIKKIEGKKNKRERKTIEEYQATADLHVVPFLGSKKLTQLTVPMVSKFVEQLQDADRSHRQIQRAVQALSMILGACQGAGYIKQNVARGFDLDDPDRREDTKVVIPDVEVVQAMLRAAREMDNEQPCAYPMFLLTAATGMRISEIRALRWSDVNFKTGYLEVAQSTDADNEPTRCKSKASYRSIPLSPDVRKVLLAWKARCPQGIGKIEKGRKGKKVEVEVKLNPLNLVFPNPNVGGRAAEKPMGYSYIREHIWQPVMLKIDGAFDTGRSYLKNKARDADAAPNEKNVKAILEYMYGWHDLRHFCASRWIEENVDPKRLVSWLGHKDFAFTVRVYGHLMKNADRDQAMVTGATGVLFVA